MLICFTKYHALRNDFLIIDSSLNRVPANQRAALAEAICDRRTGVGADGILILKDRRGGGATVELYNADGSWAEKSGNGLRIAAVHRYRTKRAGRQVTLSMAKADTAVRIRSSRGGLFVVVADLGEPQFDARRVPVKSRRRFMIQAPLKVGGESFPVTCLAVGNPHTVIFVDNFNFDWQTIGCDIERHRSFPRRTNVEFVRIVNRKEVQVAEWERGAGPTGSSGTGAAAAVCAGVMIGRLNRTCRVRFSSGTLQVTWNDQSNRIELTGPVAYVCEGTFRFP